MLQVNTGSHSWARIIAVIDISQLVVWLEVLLFDVNLEKLSELNYSGSHIEKDL